MELLITLLTIFGVNILLSGDNALVIALASRELPPHHQKTATLIGSIGAVVLRIILTFIAVFLLQIPFLKVVGGLLLVYIAVKLMVDDSVKSEEIGANSTLAGAVKTIIIADAIMSFDNIIAIAALAKGNNLLIIIGLLTSIPIIIWGSNFIRLLIQKFPIIILLGAGILGYTAGEMVISDPYVEHFLASFGFVHHIIPIIFAITVIVVGIKLKQPVTLPASAKREKNRSENTTV